MRLRFKVQQVSAHEQSVQIDGKPAKITVANVSMQPVVGAGENADWPLPPQGSIQLNSIGLPAAESLKAGREYIVEIEAA